MAAELSTSVQDTDVDVSLKNLEDSEMSVRDTGSDVSLINLEVKVKRYQPLLEEKGYNYVENGSDEEVDDSLLEVGDPPQSGAMTLGRNRMTLRRKNEDHFRAWLSADSVQMDVTLQDELLNTSNDVINPSLLEEVQPTTCLPDLERNSLQTAKRHGETVGITKTRKEYSPKEQALLKKEFTQYTVYLEKILLSKYGWSFLLDDILQIIRDVMTELADLHAKYIIYGDVRVGNIVINDHMKAFLIGSDKSKKQNNETALRDESLIDVKAMCKVMGGLCSFYMRMKPPDSQNSIKKAETALFTLLRRGYRDGITAKDFLEVLGRIIVDDQVEEQEEAPQVEAPRQLPIKKISELGSAVVNNQGRSMNSPGSEPRPEVVSNQVPLPASGATNNEGPAKEYRDKSSELDSRAMEHRCSTVGATTHAYRLSKQKEAGAVTNKISELGSAVDSSQGSEQVPEVVSNQVPLPASGAFNNEGPGESRDETSELDSRAMEDRCSTDGVTTHAILMADIEMEMYLSQ